MDPQFTPPSWYADLIRSFLDGNVPAARLQDEFFDAWRRDRDKPGPDMKGGFGARQLIDAAFTAIEHWCDNEDGSAPKGSESESALRRDLSEIEEKLRSVLG